MKIIKNIKEKYVEIKLNDPRYFDSNCIVEEKRNEQYGWGKYHNSNLKIKLLSATTFYHYTNDNGWVTGPDLYYQTYDANTKNSNINIRTIKHMSINILCNIICPPDAQ